MSSAEERPPQGAKRIENYEKGLMLVRNHGAALRDKLSGEGWWVVKNGAKYAIQPISSMPPPIFTVVDLEAQKEAMAFAEAHQLSADLLLDIRHLIPVSL